MTTEVLTLWPADVTEPTPGGARHSDPITSKLAANDATCAVIHGSKRFKLLRAYADLGALTDEQAAVRIRVTHVQATRRLSELRASSLIVPTGEYGVTEAGLPCMKCRITPGGLRALAAAKAKP